MVGWKIVEGHFIHPCIHFHTYHAQAVDITSPTPCGKDAFGVKTLLCGEKTYLGTKYSINVQHLGWFRSILSVTTKLKICNLQICSYLTYNPSKLAWHHCWLDVAPSTNSGFCIAILDEWNAAFLPQWTFTKKRMTLLSYRKGKIFCWIMIIGGRFKWYIQYIQYIIHPNSELLGLESRLWEPN